MKDVAYQTLGRNRPTGMPVFRRYAETAPRLQGWE